MSLVTFSEVSRFYGRQDVLSSVTLSVEPGEHIGLVGRNGAGKTTLIRLILGEEQPDSGLVTRARGLKIGWLPQEIAAAPDATLLDTVLDTDPEFRQVEAQLLEVEEKLSLAGAKDSPFSESEVSELAERQGRLAAGALGITWGENFLRDLRPILPPLPDGSLEKAGALLKGVTGSGPLVGFCLRGLQPEKSWPLWKAAGLVRGLKRERDARIFVVGLSSDRILYETLSSLSGEFISDFTGKTTLRDMMALGTMADLFVSVDTGAAHLMSLSGCPLLCVYTASNPAMWAPFGERRRLLCYTWATRRYALPGSSPGSSQGSPQDSPLAPPLYESHPRVGPGEAMEAALSLLP